MAIIHVSNSSSLTAALKTAVAGDTIKLASGTYNGLEFKSLSFSSAVTITSADPAKQAVITDFAMVSVKGLTFSNVEMATLNLPGQVTAGHWAFRVSDSSNISFDKVFVHGSRDGNAANDVRGLSIRDSKDISITNSEFQQLDRALAIGTSQNIKVSGNNAHELRSDAFNFAQVNNVRVENNMFNDFSPNKDDHPDAIQFWTSGTTARSTDIVISGNVVTRGGGEYTQGIFLRDQLGNMPFERVTITNNTIIGTGHSGIRVMGANDLKVTGNELVSYAGENVTNILIQNANGVIATNNKSVALSIDASTNVSQSGNIATVAVKDFGAAAIDRLVSTIGDRGGMLQGVGSEATALRLAADTEAAKDQWLKGNSKDNLLQGYGGNDTLDGGGGNDTLEGGSGDDVYFVPNGAAKIVEMAGNGVDTVIARGAHTLSANVENLIIAPGTTNGWAGTGNELHNQITGNAGSNLLSGLAGNDTIDGGVGADTILGGGGADLIIGGAGADRLTGGEGADVFRFTPGGGRDVITDFGAGVDKDLLDISAYLNAGLRPTVANVGGSAVISFTNGDAITVMGVQANELGALSKVGWVF